MIEANMLEPGIKVAELVEACQRGEEVFLMRNGVLVAQIVPMRNGSFRSGF